jgi:hypothetical protein
VRSAEYAVRFCLCEGRIRRDNIIVKARGGFALRSLYPFFSTLPIMPAQNLINPSFDTSYLVFCYVNLSFDENTRIYTRMRVIAPEI